MWPVHASTSVAASDSSIPEYFCKDGRKICVGDCALFKPPQDSPPFIGIIRKFASTKEENIRLAVSWIYRPADVKLGKGILLEAAPNEVFYSFHKDEIPAASLLHPCKVAFLRKGVELPSGISSFVCRRVYDIENKCLWWLTDKDYINERQEEVDKLLDKTRLEMHGAAHSGGRSPKPLSSPTSTPQLKPGSDSVQNTNSSFSSLVKGKKRERGDPGSDPIKRERISKTDDGETDQYRLKSQIAKITDKGGLVDFEGVEKLVQLMQLESTEKKIDLVGRIMLVDVIAVTIRFDCLGRFVQLRGLPLLDEWLQEVHTGKIGEGSSPKESDKSVEEFLFALLRALDKLPVNLHALQTCNVGKSVNYLRSHKNPEIQKKARSLVDTWKKRVEADMNVIDAKSGRSRVSLPSKPLPSEVSLVGSRKTGGTIEVGLKSSSIQPSAPKSPVVKLGPGEVVSKFPAASPGSTKTPLSIVGFNSKDPNSKMIVGAETSDPPLTPIKEEKSSSSSQSHNNSQSCSGDHAKAVAASLREDARSSTAGSVSVNKLSKDASRHRKSSNGTIIGSASSGVQKESGYVKSSPLNRNAAFEKGSPNGTTHERVPDVPLIDHGNSQRLIVRLPNTGRSPAQSGSGGSVEEPSVTFCRASPSSPAHSERHDHHDRKSRAKGDFERANIVSNAELCESKDGVAGSDEGNVSPTDAAPRDEQRRAGGDCEQLKEASKAMLLSGTASKSGKSLNASFSSINALIDSCAQFSEACASGASASPGDDVGMNLLASVAAGEISKSDNVSPLGSSRGSPAPEDSCSGGEAKLRQQDEDFAQAQGQQLGGAMCDAISEKNKTVDSIQIKYGLQQPPKSVSSCFSGDERIALSGSEETRGECSAQINSSSIQRQQDSDNPCSAPEGKHCELSYDASVALSSMHGTKECCTEGEGEASNHSQEQRNISQKERSNNVSDSILNLKSPLYEDEKVNHADDSVIREAADKNIKVDMKANEAAPCSSFDMIGEVKNPANNESHGYVIAAQKPHFSAKSRLEPVDGNIKDVLLSYSGVTLKMESTDEIANTVIAEGHTRQEEKPNKDSVSSVKEHNGDCAEENLDRKEVHGSYSSGSAMHKESKEISVQETEQRVKASVYKLDGVEADETDERHVSSVNVSSSLAAGSEIAIKLDFDLNEGFPVDDGSQGEHIKFPGPGSSSAVNLSGPLPFPLSSLSSSFPTSITVAAAAKGPFVPPENLLRTKGELGWKGSAATSAFRPAEPRKVLEMPLNTTDTLHVDVTASKQCRPPLDIDLNVADERILEDVASQYTAQRLCTDFRPGDPSAGPAGGLDLDLNRVDECPDTMQFSVNNRELENPSLLARSSLSGGFSKGEMSMSRDFDLNNGPGLDEVGIETAPLSQHAKSNVPFLSPVPAIRMNHAELGNFSSWFPPGNSYSAINIPSIFPSRGEQNYPAAGSQRILGPPVGGTSFVPEMFRGPVLSSSPAVAFSPTTTFPYPGFPFETSFPMSSNSFSGCSTSYMDSSSGGALCFPAIPSQLVGPANVVPSHYPRPYVMGLMGSTSGIGPESRKWRNHGLDLNAGPGGTDTDRRDERLPPELRQISVVGSPAQVEEQLKMYQMPGGVLKRKEPDGGWDMVADRYKHPSWQ